MINRAWTSRYRPSVLLLTCIVFIWAGSVWVLEEFNPVVSAIAGLLLSIPVTLFHHEYRSPVLVMLPEIQGLLYRFPARPKETYLINRVLVRNIGRTAAEGCKAYVETAREAVKGPVPAPGPYGIGGPEARLRVCWSVPAERPLATINVKDDQPLDFCAFRLSPDIQERKTQEEILLPTEADWPESPADCKALSYDVTECAVLVTSANTKPVSAKVRIDSQNPRVEFQQALGG